MKQRLKKNLLIYLACVCGLVLVIGISFLLGEIASRLKPDDQLLLEGEEADADANHILKICAWEKIPNEVNQKKIEDILEVEDWAGGYLQNENVEGVLPVESYVITEMRRGEPVKVGSLSKASPAAVLDGSGIQFVRYSCLSGGSVFIAEADAELGADCTLRNSGSAWGKPVANRLDMPALTECFNDDMRLQYELMFNYHPPKADLDSSALNKRRIDRPADGSKGDYLHYYSYTQRLGSVYPTVGGAFVNASRSVTESAVVFYAYDQTNPDKLLARAEIRVTVYGAWNFSGTDVSSIDYGLTLHRLGINTPENYGYTEAVLYDYWQTEEW